MLIALDINLAVSWNPVCVNEIVQSYHAHIYCSLNANPGVPVFQKARSSSSLANVESAIAPRRAHGAIEHRESSPGGSGGLTRPQSSQAINLRLACNHGGAQIEKYLRPVTVVGPDVEDEVICSNKWPEEGEVILMSSDPPRSVSDGGGRIVAQALF